MSFKVFLLDRCKLFVTEFYFCFRLVCKPLRRLYICARNRTKLRKVKREKVYEEDNFIQLSDSPMFKSYIEIGVGANPDCQRATDVEDALNIERKEVPEPVPLILVNENFDPSCL